MLFLINRLYNIVDRIFVKKYLSENFVSYLIYFELKQNFQICLNLIFKKQLKYEIFLLELKNLKFLLGKGYSLKSKIDSIFDRSKKMIDERQKNLELGIRINLFFLTLIIFIYQ